MSLCQEVGDGRKSQEMEADVPGMRAGDVGLRQNGSSGPSTNAVLRG